MSESLNGVGSKKRKHRKEVVLGIREMRIKRRWEEEKLSFLFFFLKIEDIREFCMEIIYWINLIEMVKSSTYYAPNNKNTITFSFKKLTSKQVITDCDECF